jgi:hypothetical protein
MFFEGISSKLRLLIGPQPYTEVQSTKLVLGIAVTIKGSAIKSSLKKLKSKTGRFPFSSK